MLKHLPSRNHRSKGLKVKHVLQICVLLAIGVWLIYQVKHSRGKSRVFETKDGNDIKLRGADEVERFGRKDIPKIKEISTEGEKNEEEDDDEKEGEEEEKHEDDDSEKEDVRLVERDEERGVGDDEIDENDDHEAEKTEVESEHEDEVVDEDKEKDEKEENEEKDEREEKDEKEENEEKDEREEKEENEEKDEKEENEEKDEREENEEKEEEVSTEEDHTESEENKDIHEKGHSEEEENEDAGKEGHTDPEENEDVNKEGDNKRKVKSDEHDHVAERTNTREAQEELYRGDDASSEVTHNVQSVIPETKNLTMDHSNKIWGEVNVGQKYETDDADGLKKPRVQPTEDVDSVISNATNSEVNLTELGDTEVTSNSTVGGGENSVTLLSNGTKTNLDSNLSQNDTVELAGHEAVDFPGNSTVKPERVTDDMHLQEAATDANKAENVNTNTGESQSSYNTTLASTHVTNDTDTMEAAKDSSVGDEIQGEKAKNNGKKGSDEDSKSHSDKGTDAVQHDPIDASDITTLAQEEKESRTDLDKLPEIRTEVQNTEDTVAE